MTAPAPPEGVRIVLRDGTEVPCEVYYLGPDQHGIHLWMVTAAVPFDQIAQIRCEVFPARTAFVLREPDEE